jgi:hypothetical protein
MIQFGTFNAADVKRKDNGDVVPSALLEAMYAHFDLNAGDEQSLYALIKRASPDWSSTMPAINLIRHAATYPKATKAISKALNVSSQELWPSSAEATGAADYELAVFEARLKLAFVAASMEAFEYAIIALPVGKDIRNRLSERLQATRNQIKSAETFFAGVAK